MITVASVVPYLGGALAVGGVAVVVSRRRELILRWCAWALGVPVVVAAFASGQRGIAVLAVAAGLIGVLEYGGLMCLPWVDRVVLGAALVGVALTTWLSPDDTFRVVGIGALALAAVPVLAGDASNGLRRVSGSLLGLAWLGLLAAMGPLGTRALVLFIAVSVADIIASFAGRGLGGPGLSPLSPAKRWGGAVAGAVAGIGALAVLSALSWPLAAAVAVGGPAGDLFESMVKRGARAKDSAGWLAGAGGLLDRIDSLLGALAVVLVLR